METIENLRTKKEAEMSEKGKIIGNDRKKKTISKNE